MRIPRFSRFTHTVLDSKAPRPSSSDLLAVLMSSSFAMGRHDCSLMRRRRVTPSLTLLLMAALLCGLLQPASVQAQTDQCKLYNRISNSCDVQTICSNCVSTSGCKFDILLGRCDNATTSAGVPDVTYCAANDTRCSSCTATSARPVCYSEDYSCICPVMCTVIESARSACKQEMPIATVWLGFGAFAFVLPFLLYIQRKCNEPRGLQQMLYNRRRRAARRAERLRREQERDRTLDLTLTEWRDHREQHKLEMGEIELKTCYLLFKDAKMASLPPHVLQERSTVSSEDDDAELSDVCLDGGTHVGLDTRSSPLRAEQQASTIGDGGVVEIGVSDKNDTETGQHHIGVTVDERR